MTKITKKTLVTTNMGGIIWIASLIATIAIQWSFMYSGFEDLSNTVAKHDTKIENNLSEGHQRDIILERLLTSMENLEKHFGIK